MLRFNKKHIYPSSLYFLSERLSISRNKPIELKNVTKRKKKEKEEERS